jgi:hypothetical protein
MRAQLRVSISRARNPRSRNPRSRNSLIEFDPALTNLGQQNRLLLPDRSYEPADHFDLGSFDIDLGEVRASAPIGR